MLNSRPITTIKVFDAEALANAGTKTSEFIDLREIAQDYEFSLEYIITGSGTITILYLVCSTIDGTYIDAGTDLLTAGTGESLISFTAGEPELAPFMKIKITETGTNTAGVTVYLNVQ